MYDILSSWLKMQCEEMVTWTVDTCNAGMKNNLKFSIKRTDKFEMILLMNSIWKTEKESD